MNSENFIELNNNNNLNNNLKLRTKIGDQVNKKKIFIKSIKIIANPMVDENINIINNSKPNNNTMSFVDKIKNKLKLR